jgi:hypothetical protein
MTIAEANVTLRFALPQGWTKTDIEDHLNDLLVVLSEKAEERGIMLESEHSVTHVDADPFINSKLRQTPTVRVLPLAMR